MKVGMLRALAALLLVLGSASARSRLGAAPGDGPRQPRQPLLGLAIEKDATGGTYRVVQVGAHGGPASEPLAAGTPDECEAKRLEMLTELHGRGRVNLPFPTLGGKQFWADEFIGCGWRIQQNVITGHSRLLDPQDRREAWGSYEQCRIDYERRRIRDGLLPRSDHLVLLIHGLFRSKDSFRRMTSALEKRGFDVAAVTYPSTRGSIGEHADGLEKVLERLEDYSSVSFVTHSLGGIVVRALLSRRAPWQKRIEVRRLVMLGPPNRGSVVAEMLRDWLPYRALAGQAAVELSPEDVSRIPPPSCSFGIIAGGTGTPRGVNPILGGDNDGTVLVENTRLDSADDFLLVRALHSFMMHHEEVIEATARFLERGKFRP